MPDSVEARFPVGGVDIARAFAKQQPRLLPQGQWGTTGQIQVVPGVGPEKVPSGVYGRTCADAMNVRSFEATSDRRRGGTRPALKKYLPVRPVADWLTQDLNSMVGSGTAVELSQSGRVVYLVTVVQGVVYWSVVGSGIWTAAVNVASGTPPLNFDGIMFSATNQQKLYFADGTNKVYWDPADKKTHNWVASAGTFPVDSDNNTARLIETWRGRTIHSGFLKASQDITMSATDNPNDYNLAPVPFVVTQAVELSTGQAGVVGDTVTGMIPWSDDLLIIGGNSSIKVLQGEPTDGGKLMDLTTRLGMAWGRAWCRDPFGGVYFCSSNLGVFSWSPGNRPQPISQAIKRRLENIDTGANGIRMEWDNQDQCVHLFISPLSAPGPSENWTYEARTGSWFPFKFKNQKHQPLSMCTVDGNLESDRGIVMGSWTGYVYKFDKDAEDDDGTEIESSVVIGPINSKTLEEMMLHEIQAVMGEDSGEVTFEVFVGKTAEKALSSTAVYSGKWKSGRTHTFPARRSAHAVYVKISSTDRWALEQIRISVSQRGLVRQRA